MQKLSIARLVISLIAVVTMVSPYIADFNATHVYNPTWPGHAKFHNGQTMTLGLICGVVAIYLLWVRNTSTALENLKGGCVFSALYWVAMAPAILYPGAAFWDPGTPVPPFGLNQVKLDVAIFIILGACYYFERGRILRLQSAIPSTPRVGAGAVDAEIARS